MKVETKEIYSEVYQILNLLGTEYTEKLPATLMNMLKEKRAINYNPQYTEDLPLNEQNIRKETMAIIVLLYLNYWCEDENEVAEINNILKNNEEKYQLELRERYNPDNIFKKQKQETKNVEEQIANETAMIPYKKSIFARIICKIYNVFPIKK